MHTTDTQGTEASELGERIKRILRAEPGLSLAVLYGSAATGTMRADSDVDIALLFTRPMNAEQKMDLISRLAGELQRDVDVVDLFSLSGTLLKQILRKGRVLMETRSGTLARLLQRMIHNQSDMMPYVTRTLLERQRRFIHG